MIMACPPEAALTPEQRSALLDILTHHQTYADIAACKEPDVVRRFGYPFDQSSTSASASCAAPQLARLGIQDDDFQDADEDPKTAAPLLQTLLTQFVLPLPGVENMPSDFWSVRAHGLMLRLAEAELSESYDKGALGTRKTLATGSSALLERVVRGTFGGVPRKEGQPGLAGEYDCGRAEDLERAWDDLVQGLVYGDAVDDFFDHMGRTEDLEGHSPGLKAVADYVLIHLAAGAHHVLTRSPEGPYLLKLIENVHGLIPYKMIKQTLRVGNAATMMSGMMRILLAKLSLTSVTNWMGLTSSADDGMNLLQRIVSLVLSWDAADFRKGADAMEKAKDRPSDQVLAALRDHAGSADRDAHDAVRAASVRNGQSVVAAVLAAASLDAPLVETHHAQCLEYYSALLSVRDRDAITAALCRQPPDLLTQAVRDTVAAYDPIIRSVHARVDLRDHVDALQGFVDDLTKASRPAAGARPPTVDDYVQLLRRNRLLLYRWLHAVASRAPDVWASFRAWAKASVVKFRQPSDGGAIDARLDGLHRFSRARLQTLASGGPDAVAPGVYLARWQAFLDDTAVTPADRRGPVRRGSDVRHLTTVGKTGAAGGDPAPAAVDQGPPLPDVAVVLRALAAGFGRVVRDVAAEAHARDVAAAS